VLVDQIRNPARLPIRVIIRPRLTVRASCRAND
jgi:hypothetical protein